MGRQDRHGREQLEDAGRLIAAVHVATGALRATIAHDGKYGPESRSVCMQFQAEKGLKADGLVGHRTWEASWTKPVT